MNRLPPQRVSLLWALAALMCGMCQMCLSQPALLSPKNNGVNVSVSPTLSWSAVPTAKGYDFQVWLNGNIIFQNTNGPLVGTSIKAKLDYLAHYQWRTRARVLPQNNPWSEYWSFTTEAIPGPPIQNSPLNGADGLGTTVVLQWSSVPGATAYDYMVLQAGNVVAQALVLGTSVTLKLDYGAAYTWRIRARVAPQNNPWSGDWSFTTKGVPIPVRLTPANNATGLNPSVQLAWNGVAEASGYDYEALDGTTLVGGDGITYSGPYQSTSATLSLEYGKTYRWRVRARVLPQNNPWSDYWSFTTKDVPVAVQLAPANGATGLDPWVQFSWSAVAEAKGYDYQVLDGTTLVGGDGITYSGPYQSTRVTLRLDYDKSYRWRVRARFLPQNNPWSDYWSFTTGPIPGSPILVWPSQGAEVGNPVTFQWSPSAGNPTFTLELWHDNSLERRISGLKDTSYARVMTPGRAYRWRIVATENGKSVSSDLVAFSVPPQDMSNVEVELDGQDDTVHVRSGDPVYLLATVAVVASDEIGIDLNDIVSNVEFLSGSTSIGKATNSPYEFSWVPVTEGVSMITAKVHMRSGGVLVSQAMEVHATNCVDCPRVVDQPGDQPVMVGDPASFEVKSVSPIPQIIEWEFMQSTDGEHPIVDNWSTVSITNGSVYSIASAGEEHEGFYRAKISNAAGVTYSREAHLAVAAEQDDGVALPIPDPVTLLSGSFVANGIWDTASWSLELGLRVQAQVLQSGVDANSTRPGQPSIRAFGVTPDGACVLFLDMIDGAGLRVMTSNDLRDWTPLGEVSVIESEIIVRPLSSSQVAFYKVEYVEQ